MPRYSMLFASHCGHGVLLELGWLATSCDIAETRLARDEQSNKLPLEHQQWRLRCSGRHFGAYLADFFGVFVK